MSAALLFAAAHIAAAGWPLSSPRLEPPVQVFTAGQRDVHNQSIGCFRIPALVQTRSGLLAFAEGRVGGCRPDVEPDRPIVVRASNDDGASWGPVRYAVAPDANASLNYPAPVVLADGTILLIFHVWQAEHVLATRSSDGGLSWAAPAPVPSLPAACAEFSPAVLPRPGGGGGGATRLVAACAGFAALSEDGGVSWWRSAGNVSLGANVTPLGEPTIVADGRAGGLGLSMFVRVSSHDPLRNHALAQSEDGGETWSAARLLSLEGTSCEGGLGHDPEAAVGELLLAAPAWSDAGLGGRRNVSLWTLDGAARPAAEPGNGTQVWGGAGGYSAFDSTGGRVRLLFEGGNHIYDWGVKMSRIRR